ncbi:MAG: biotin transporter BioY [Corynebacterium sp.]|uniref:biotin transporter BioY n=1 Tax=Corynebacterium sp. TaxID=1720 RepID=UPI0026DBCAFA|nr:biotin transporter BioY [Corynebacterium sp.]MDO5098047.1 biotin transporter BioY [Corynebacterium sp.]
MTTQKTSSNTLLDVAYIAVFAALIIVLAFVAIPVGAAGVPIVLQNAAVILTGLVLGPKRGFLAVALFLGLGLIGLPVLSGGKTTLAAIAGPTVGYLVGYLIAVIVAGLISYASPKGKSNTLIAFLIVAGLAALATQYLCGTIGLMIRSDMTLTAAAAVNLPFIIPDLGKLAAVVVIAYSVLMALPDIRNRR